MLVMLLPSSLGTRDESRECAVLASRGCKRYAGITPLHTSYPTQPHERVHSECAGYTPPPRFSIDAEKGLYHLPNDQDKGPYWISSPIYINALTRKIDGENWGRLLEFKDPGRQAERMSLSNGNARRR